MQSGISQDKDKDKARESSETSRGRCSRWLSSPSFYIYINFFLSQWGDWMWQFAVGLYLVHLDNNLLRLAAVFGFTGGTCVLLFGGVIGDWVDRNQRLKVVRVSLFIQNLSVALSAIGVCLALVFDPNGECATNKSAMIMGLGIILRIGVVGLAILAQLSSVAYKIAIEKDWLVEIAEGNAKRLANLNATTRSLDLACKVVAPLTAGLIMTYGSLLVSAVCLAVWNVLSVFVEYALLRHVYTLLPRLAFKNVNKEQPNTEKEMDELNKESVEKFQSKEHLPYPSNSQESSSLLNGNTAPEISPETFEKKEQMEIKTPNDSKDKEIKKGNPVVEFLLVVRKGWMAYYRQRVVFAGLSLALLYMTVLGFDSITIGYIKVNKNVEEWHVGLSMGLAGVTGIIGALLFTRLHRSIGLNKTGLIAFTAEILCLTLAVASIWAPGSQLDMSKLFVASETGDLGKGCAVQTTTVGPGGFGDLTQSSGDLIDGGQLDSGTTTVSVEGDEGVNVSIILLLTGIILSRVGLWMADLVVTQLMQEAIVELERGIVNGVQNSLNMLMDMLKFALVIALPRIETFGLHIILSFSFICTAGLFFVGHVVHSGRLKRSSKRRSEPAASEVAT